MTAPEPDHRLEGDLERGLERGLDQRARRVYGTPVSLADVRTRARSIRRRRTAAVTVGVAAAVAAVVVVPTALAGLGGHRGERPEPAPAVPATGQPTGVLHGDRFTRPDGTVVRLAAGGEGLAAGADVSQVAALTDGRTVVADQRRSAIEVYAADGSLEQRHPVVTLSLTSSPTGTLVAWLDADGRVEVLEAGSSDPVRLAPVPMPGEATPMIDAVLGDDCAAGGCSVLAGDGTETLSQVTIAGAEDLVTPELMRVDDVSPDGSAWAVTFPPTDADPQYGCVGLYDPSSRQVTARTCDTANPRFAPDGRHLVGGFFENGSASEVQVLDRDLRVLRTYDPGAAVVSRAGWADPGHVLAAVAAPSMPGGRPAWSLVRVPVDDGGDGGDGGDPEVVEGPVAGVDPELGAEFLLAE